MVKRKVRDIYGNWTWEDTDQDNKNPTSEGSSEAEKSNVSEKPPIQSQDSLNLEWRDYIALIWASLETYLLPIVVFMIILLVLAIFFTHV